MPKICSDVNTFEGMLQKWYPGAEVPDSFMVAPVPLIRVFLTPVVRRWTRARMKRSAYYNRQRGVAKSEGTPLV